MSLDLIDVFGTGSLDDDDLSSPPSSQETLVDEPRLLVKRKITTTLRSKGGFVGSRVAPKGGVAKARNVKKNTGGALSSKTSLSSLALAA